MGKIPLKKNNNSRQMQVRKFKSISDTNLADATKSTYNRYFISLFEWSDSTGIYTKFVKIPNPKKSGATIYDNTKCQEQFVGIPNDELQNMLENFLEYQKSRVEEDIISPNTVPKFFKPYKYILEINYREHAVKWKPIQKMYPTQEKRTGFRPWSTEQIEEMLKVASSSRGKMATFRNKAGILFHSSTGTRVGVHNDPLLLKHMIKMTHPDFAYHFYAILIYAEVDESIEEKDQRILTDEVSDEDYSKFVFLIPEASRAIDEYHAYRQKSGETFDENTPIFTIIKEFDKKIDHASKIQMSGNAFRHVMEYTLGRSTIVRQKKRNRYSTMIDHGYRKRYNTILKLNKNINPNIAESLMQHARGLDGAYLKPTREEQFVELIKAVNELTVNPAERQKNLIKTNEQQILELKIQNQKLKQKAEQSDLDAKKIKFYEPLLEKLFAEEEKKKNQSVTD